MSRWRRADNCAIEEILDLEQLEVNIYRGSVFSPDRASCSALSAATWPGSRWCRRCARSTRAIRCTRCTATSCGREMPRRPRCSSSSGCATVARSPPVASTRSSTARPSSRCRRRSRPTRAASNTRTRCPSAPPPDDLPGLTEMQGVRRRRLQAVRGVGRPHRAAGAARSACPARHPSSRCGSATATRCPTTTCCTSARWPT